MKTHLTLTCRIQEAAGVRAAASKAAQEVFKKLGRWLLLLLLLLMLGMKLLSLERLVLLGLLR